MFSVPLFEVNTDSLCSGNAGKGKAARFSSNSEDHVYSFQMGQPWVIVAVTESEVDRGSWQTGWQCIPVLRPGFPRGLSVGECDAFFCICFKQHQVANHGLASYPLQE